MQPPLHQARFLLPTAPMLLQSTRRSVVTQVAAVVSTAVTWDLPLRAKGKCLTPEAIGNREPRAPARGFLLKQASASALVTYLYRFVLSLQPLKLGVAKGAK